MAAYDILPSTSLSDTDIRDTIREKNLGSCTFDSRSWFLPEAKINKWSKKKPLKWASLVLPESWWKANDGNCGLIIPEYLNISALVAAVDAGVTWEYDMPQGTSIDPLNSAHFRGYKAAASAPFANFYAPSTAYNNAANSVIGAAIITSVGGDDYNLGLGDFDKIKDWYFGAYMVKSSGSALYPRYITTSNTVATGASSVEIPIYGLPAGTYYVYPFLCENPRININDPEPANLFVAFDSFSRKTVSISNNPIYVFIAAQWQNEDVNSGVIEMELRLTNNGSSSVTLQNCYAAMRYRSNAYQDPYQIGERSEFLDAIAIPASSTVTRNLSFLVDNSDSTSGWKGWFSTTSPYNIVVGSDVMQPFT